MDISEAILSLGSLSKAEYLAARAYAITKPVYILKTLDPSTICKTSPFGTSKCGINDINIGDTVTFKCSLSGVDGNDLGEGQVTADMISDFEFDPSEKKFLLECSNMIITTLPIKWPLKAVEYISKNYEDFNQKNLTALTTASASEYMTALEEFERVQQAPEQEQDNQLVFE